MLSSSKFPRLLRTTARVACRADSKASAIIRPVSSATWKFDAFGSPSTVLKFDSVEIKSKLGPKDVAVDILAAPINPMDFNVIEGVYGVKTTLPAVGGNEGVGVVTEVGSAVSELSVGDWVIPSGNGFGTWRERVVSNEESLLKVPSNMCDPIEVPEQKSQVVDEEQRLSETFKAEIDRLLEIHYGGNWDEFVSSGEFDVSWEKFINQVHPEDRDRFNKEKFRKWSERKMKFMDFYEPPLYLKKSGYNASAVYASTISVNPSTAYRLLRDFKKLNKGDVIIQNGANSMVGLAVIQMAYKLGIKTINIIRSDRPDYDTTLRLLDNLGGDINLPDTFLNTASFNEIVKELPPISLAFNCVGGDVVNEMSRVLAPGATIVTYGGMSKRPITVPFDLIASKQLQFKSFWMSKWHSEHSRKERSEMIEDIADLIRKKDLVFFYELHDFDDFSYALAKSQEPFKLRKVVLSMKYPDRMEEHDKLTEDDYKFFEAPDGHA